MPTSSDLIDDLPRESREELVRIETERAKRRHKKPLNYLYKPIKVQEIIHKLVLPVVTALFSANRFGKSLLGLAETLWRMDGEHPYKQVPKAPVNLWIVVPSFNFFEETVMRGLWAQWGPRDGSVRLRRAPQLQFEHRNGSIATVMSQEMDLRKFMGASVDFVWIDEQCDQDKFEEIMVRLAVTGGPCLYTATLVGGLGWEYEQLWLPGQSNHPDIVSFSGALCVRDPMRELEIGDPTLPPTHPMGNREAIVKLARQIPDPQMRNTRIFGEIAGRTGLILPFDDVLNKCNRFSVPNHWPVWIGLDPGFYGFSASFQTIGPGDVVFVWDEYHSQRESVYTRAVELSDRCRKLGRDFDDPIPVFVDCEDQQVIHELNLQFQVIIEQDPTAPQLAATSLEYKKKALKAGLARMQWALYPDPELIYPENVLEHRGHFGCPHLLVFDDVESNFVDHRGTTHDTCRHAWEMSRWSWKKNPEGHMIKDEADDYQADGAHMMAAMRYGLMTRFGAMESTKVGSGYDSHWYTIMKRLGQLEEENE